MRSRRQHSPRPVTCKHPRLHLATRNQEGGDQLDIFLCPDCKNEVMLWISAKPGGQLMLSYNHASVKL